MTKKPTSPTPPLSFNFAQWIVNRLKATDDRKHPELQAIFTFFEWFFDEGNHCVASLSGPLISDEMVDAAIKDQQSEAFRLERACDATYTFQETGPLSSSESKWWNDEEHQMLLGIERTTDPIMGQTFLRWYRIPFKDIAEQIAQASLPHYESKVLVTSWEQLRTIAALSSHTQDILLLLKGCTRQKYIWYRKTGNHRNWYLCDNEGVWNSLTERQMRETNLGEAIQKACLFWLPDSEKDMQAVLG